MLCIPFPLEMSKVETTSNSSHQDLTDLNCSVTIFNSFLQGRLYHPRKKVMAFFHGYAREEKTSFKVGVSVLGLVYVCVRKV